MQTVFKPSYQETIVKLEEQTYKNSEDIHELTVSVTRIATIQENSEKRRDRDMEMFREAVTSINKLNERVSGYISMEKDIATLRELLSEKMSDIRTIRHDVNNMSNTLTGLPIINEKLGDASKAIAERVKVDEAIDARVIALEAWKNKAEGGALAIKTGAIALWSMGGSMIITLLWSFLKSYFSQKTGGVIGGE